MAQDWYVSFRVAVSSVMQALQENWSQSMMVLLIWPQEQRGGSASKGEPSTPKACYAR